MITQEKKSARIYEFRIKNFKGVDVFEKRIENGKMVVYGKNGSGKSSILDGLYMALKGKKLPNKIDNPVGAKGSKAEVEIRINAEPGATELGEKLFIQFGITDSGTVNLSITDEETGLIHKTSPRKKIDKLIGMFLDPVEMMKDLEKPHGDRLLAEKLCAMVGLDLKPFVDKEAELFELFQDENKELKRQKALIDSLDVPQENWPKKYTDPLKISEDLQKLNSLKSRNEERVRNIVQAHRQLDQGIEISNKIAETIETAKIEAESAMKGVETLADTLAKKKIDFLDVQEENKPIKWTGTENIEEKIQALMKEQAEKKKYDQAEAVKKQRIDTYQQNLILFEEKVKSEKKAADEKAETSKQKQIEHERHKDVVGQLADKADRSHDENVFEKWIGQSSSILISKMTSVTKDNKLFQDRVAYEDAEVDINTVKESIDRINKDRSVNAEEKGKAVANAKEKFPHPGITVDEKTVWVDLEDGKGKRTINDLSEGETLMICCYFIIAGNTGPLNILVVRNGSSLDSDNKQIIYGIAAEHGYDVVLETIETSEVGALHIVEGNIESVNMPEDPEEAEKYLEEINSTQDADSDVELEEIVEHEDSDSKIKVEIEEVDNNESTPVW